MDKNQAIILSVFAVYLLLMVGIGFIFYRKKMSTSEYMLGGRNLNAWVTAFSAQASDMSGWLLTGIPGLCCLFAALNPHDPSGLKNALYVAIGLLIGTACNWIFVAKRLRVYTEVASNSITVPSYFENRFDDKKGILQTIAGVVILIFFTVYAASMFSAGAKLFEEIFGLQYHYALLVGAAVIVIYTMLGGFLAVSWTDLIQGLIMFFALILVPALVIKGFTDAQFDTLAALARSFGSIIPMVGDGSEFTWVSLISGLGWGLGYFGMPHILVRFMGTKNKKTIKPATGIALTWSTITMGCAILIGVIGGIVVPGLNESNQELVFMKLVSENFSPIVAGILLSAILAAIMSTADSQLLVASSSFAEDIYKRHFRKNASDKETLFVSRMSIVALSAVAILIALDPNSQIFELVEYAWGGFGAAFGPLLLFSLYSKKIKKSGAIASIITGALVTVVWRYGLAPIAGGDPNHILMLYEIIPGFIASSLVLWIVSLLDKRPLPEKVEKDFDTFKAKLKSKVDDISEPELALAECGASKASTQDIVSEETVSDNNLAQDSKSEDIEK